MIDVDFEIDWRTLERALKGLPASMAKTQLRGAMKKALEPVAVDMERLAPIGPTGNLKKSIEIAPKLSRSQVSERVSIPGGVYMHVGSTAPHAHLVEFGTCKTAKHPFLRPAWDKNRRKVLSIFVTEVWKNLERTAKRLAKQAAAGKLSKKGARALGV